LLSTELTPLVNAAATAPILGRKGRRRLRCAYGITLAIVFGGIFVFFVFPALHPYVPHVDPTKR